MQDRDQGEPRRGQGSSEARQGAPEQILARMAQNRMRQDVVEICPAAVGREIVKVVENRPLQGDHILADLAFDPVFDQPAFRIQTDIFSVAQIWNQQPAGPQRTAPEIQHFVLFPEAERSKQTELGRANGVVFVRRPYEGAVVR